ncbi:MAG: SwmB domain-containing protein [Betaproteobacteria bacterium]
MTTPPPLRPAATASASITTDAAQAPTMSSRRQDLGRQAQTPPASPQPHTPLTELSPSPARKARKLAQEEAFAALEAQELQTGKAEVDEGAPQQTPADAPLLLAQAPAGAAAGRAESTQAATQGTSTSNAPSNPADATPSMESRLLTPLTQTSSWVSADWFGAVPIGAAGTGALLALAALTGSGGGGGSSPTASPPTPDTQAPVLQSAQISDSAGTQLVLNYDEFLGSTLPDKSAFQVLVDGNATTVTAVARGTDFKSVVLTLGTAVTSPKTVQVSLGDGNAIKDLAGNAAASLRDQAVTVTDKVAPSLVSSTAVTNASQSVIVLRYSEDLLASGQPATTQFGVLVDGGAASISSAQILGDSVRLTLGSRITASSPTIKLSYAPPSDSAKALQDAAGNRAAALDTPGGIAVSYSQDSVAPTLSSSSSAVAAVDRSARQIRLTFTEPLDASALPAAASLSVDVSSAGSTRSVAVSSLKLAGTTLELTLAEAVSDPLAGLRVRYSPPASGAALQDWAGNPVAAFDRSVTTVDAVAPTLISSRFTSDRALELTFDEALGAIGPDKGAFMLTANGGSELKPVASAVSGKTLTLTFDTAIGSGQAATLRYAAPTKDPSALNQALQDASGNDSASLSSTPDTTAPALSSATTSSNGLQVLLNYNEALLSPSSSGTPVIPAVAVSSLRVFKGSGQQASVTSVLISGSQVQVTLDSAILPNETVSVFYIPPAASIGVNNAAIQDSSGNDAAALGSGVNGQTVSNQALPAVSQALLDTQAAPFDRVLLTLNEAYTGALPDKSAFVVKVGGSTQSIASLSGSGQDLVLQLSSPVSSPGEVRVTYTVPGSNPLKGASGKNMASFDQAYGQLITGSSSDDTLSGQAGRVDYFLGSAGNDSLSGLGGADQYVWPSFAGGPGGWRQTLKDFGFKKGSGSLQGSTEADTLDLSQLLVGYSDANKSQFLRFSKNSDGKLMLEVDHDGGASFSTTATLVFDNVTVDASNQVLAGGQFVNDSGSNLVLSNVLTHLMSQSQLVVL